MVDYARTQDARRGLHRAGQKIVAEDPGYALVRCQRRSGWVLVVRRVRGAKARAKARQGAVWRSSGITAESCRRAQRQRVRAALRASLGG